jgi:hypothetical protein
MSYKYALKLATLPEFLPPSDAQELMAQLIKLVTTGGYVERANNRQCPQVAHKHPHQLPAHLGTPDEAARLQIGTSPVEMASQLEPLGADMKVWGWVSGGLRVEAAATHGYYAQATQCMVEWVHDTHIVELHHIQQ